MSGATDPVSSQRENTVSTTALRALPAVTGHVYETLGAQSLLWEDARLVHRLKEAISDLPNLQSLKSLEFQDSFILAGKFMGILRDQWNLKRLSFAVDSGSSVSIGYLFPQHAVIARPIVLKHPGNLFGMLVSEGAHAFQQDNIYRLLTGRGIDEDLSRGVPQAFRTKYKDVFDSEEALQHHWLKSRMEAGLRKQRWVGLAFTTPDQQRTLFWLMEEGEQRNFQREDHASRLRNKVLRDAGLHNGVAEAPPFEGPLAIPVDQYDTLLNSGKARWYHTIAHSRALAAGVPVAGAFIEGAFLAGDVDRLNEVWQEADFGSGRQQSYAVATGFSASAFAATGAEMFRRIPLGVLSGSLGAVGGSVFAGIDCYETIEKYSSRLADGIDVALSATGFTLNSVSAVAWVARGALLLLGASVSPAWMAVGIAAGLAAVGVGLFRAGREWLKD